MKKEVRLLRDKAVNSLIVSIEHFNRPYDRGGVETVLILLDHAFEMLLKASILHRGGRIREPKAKQTIGFDACIRQGVSNGDIRFLSDEQALTLQGINSLRDAAQHHLVDVSEQHLYIQIQAGLTLFRDLYRNVYEDDLALELPSRVLPLSTTPPTDLAGLFDSEVAEVARLLRPGSRKRLEATAKLRALAILEGAIQGERVQPSNSDLRKLTKGIREGVAWELLFPGVASIAVTTESDGHIVNMRFTKKEGIPTGASFLGEGQVVMWEEQGLAVGRQGRIVCSDNCVSGKFGDSGKWLCE
ncbi:MAG: hypothetical protein HYX78_11520, partial [Armatimonadetes bacterium]|nr:hypothetical protein [Armatimonadota bacterium]